MIKVSVAGATGRLGSRFLYWIDKIPGHISYAAFADRPDHEWLTQADLVVDATRLELSRSLVRACIERDQKILVATSGWVRQELEALLPRLKEHPGAGVFVVPNLSIASALVSVCASAIAPYFDTVEIVETHHRAKVDAPSGTAKYTAELIAKTTSVEPPIVSIPARGEVVCDIPVHSIRLDGVQARQQVHLGAGEERVSLEHESQGYECYRRGFEMALRALPGMTGVTVGLDTLLRLGRFIRPVEID